MKGADKVSILATEKDGQYYGNEYLGLYPKIDIALGGMLGRFPPGNVSGFRL